MQNEINAALPRTGKPYQSRREAAEYLASNFGLRCGASKLAKLACDGGGPVFRKTTGGHVIYARGDLDEWAAGQLSQPQRSTSET